MDRMMTQAAAAVHNPAYPDLAPKPIQRAGGDQATVSQSLNLAEAQADLLLQRAMGLHDPLTFLLGSAADPRVPRPAADEGGPVEASIVGRLHRLTVQLSESLAMLDLAHKRLGEGL